MIVRFEYQGHVHHGLLEEGQITGIEGDIFNEYYATQTRIPLSEVKLLAPVQPSKIVCVGLNYIDHAREVNLEIPKAPLFFLKPSTTVVGPEDRVVYPTQSQRVDYEAELGIVIKKKTYQVSEQEASDYILGYTCANDVTARDIQFADGQWTRGKSFDTFCPIGPGIVPNLDPSNLEIKLMLNGEVKQISHTSNLIFSVPYLVHYISQVMTLLPGDVIITGTPAGIGPMDIGDEVCVYIEEIGELKNYIASTESR
ncbi:fumarylacetoacetate hydrolase family protein [Ammoniphilus sp. YIM 78166]|uniref:fumarylacetoacetate hydrolase family protein n=1 Tax=Ammoniphilus sp. YIM 78166 TaxID=1644106 RepID=UPI00106FE701|nr:fumarylacetoacetate hydrolase family protein [Ammoniphilus sp. YIM 78166]